MSEHITHVAIYEDMSRMALRSDWVPEAFKASLQSAWDVGLLASASRGVHLTAVPLLEKYRTLWESRSPGDGVEERIAAALGWLAHRAADMQMKVLEELFIAEMAEGRPNPFGFYKDEFEIYQDSVAFREVYKGGEIQPKSPYSPFSPATLATNMRPHPAAEAVHVENVEPLIAAQMNIQLLDLHTPSNRNLNDTQLWLDAFFGRRQRFAEPLPVYIEGFQDPPAEKMAHYMDRWDWYNAGDDVIRWARALQRDTPPPNISLDDAIDAGRTQSQYAQALHKGMFYFRKAGDFFEHRIEKADLHDAIDNFVEDWRQITY